MAKFQYRMQSILDLKEKMENQAKIAYGIANNKLSEEQEKLFHIMTQKAGYEKRAQELMNGQLQIDKIKDNKKSIETMK